MITFSHTGTATRESVNITNQSLFSTSRRELVRLDGPTVNERTLRKCPIGIRLEQSMNLNSYESL